MAVAATMSNLDARMVMNCITYFLKMTVKYVEVVTNIENSFGNRDAIVRGKTQIGVFLRKLVSEETDRMCWYLSYFKRMDPIKYMIMDVQSSQNMKNTGGMIRSNQQPAHEPRVVGDGTMVKHRASSHAEESRGQATISRPTHAFLKRLAVSVRQRQCVAACFPVHFHRGPQETVPSQNLKKLARHERVKIHDRVIFDPDVLRVSAGQNQQRSPAKRSQTRVRHQTDDFRLLAPHHVLLGRDS